MIWTLSELGRRLRALARRGRIADDLDEELADHLAALQRQFEDEGVGADEARRRARLRLGGPVQTRESAGDAWQFRRAEAWLRDLRLSVRTLRRQPIFSLAAVATFALGIGAATSIFSVVYGVAFRPLPYPGADRLVRLYEANTATNELKLQVSQGTFEGWREMVPALEEVALFGKPSTVHLAGDATPSATMMAVSPRFFDVLGVAPMLGRTFKPDAEYTRFTAAEVVLSYEAWQRLFGGDPGILDRAVAFARRSTPLRVVGVMPRGFTCGEPVDFWQPNIVELPIARVVRSWRYDRAIGRLRPDRTIDQLRAELGRASARLAADYPATNAGWTTTVEPLRDATIGAFGRASWLFLAAVAAVLLVACANVAGLLTARAMGRTRETSVRIALGAGRWRLTQLWLSEAAVLAATGAVAGVVMAGWLVRLLRAVAPPGLPRIDDVAVDLPVLAVACAATAFSAIVCAVVPLAATRARALPDGLRAGAARSGDSPGRRRMSATLVALQCAAALALVVIAVVFARSVIALTAVDLGWRPAHVLGMTVAPAFPAENRRPWFLYVLWGDQLVQRLEATPGIARAAIATDVPFGPSTYPAEIAIGRDKVPDETRRPIGLHMVTDGYFDTLGIRLRGGRWFTRDDRFGEAELTGTADVPSGAAIVTESVARALWPGQDAVGQSFRLPTNDRAPYRVVVGVVADVQFTTVGAEPALDVFLPWAQNPTGAPRLVVRATGDPVAMAPAVRAAVVGANPGTLIEGVTDVASLVARATAPARFTSRMIATLGGLALVLAGVGVYGSLSTLVGARARDIAVRLALGASASHTLWRTLLQGLSPVAIGSAAGVGIAGLTIASVRGLLFGVSRVDAGSVGAGAAIVLVVTTVACVVPAVRAARTNPLDVLRGD